MRRNLRDQARLVPHVQACTLHKQACAYVGDLARQCRRQMALVPPSGVLGERSPRPCFDAEMVGARGIEPPTPCTPCRCATRLRYAPTLIHSLYRLQPPGPRSWRISSMTCRSWSGESAAPRRTAGPAVPPSSGTAAESSVSVSSRWRAPLMVNPCS
jgi:hypothetical protein